MLFSRKLCSIYHFSSNEIQNVQCKCKLHLISFKHSKNTIPNLHQGQFYRHFIYLYQTESFSVRSAYLFFILLLFIFVAKNKRISYCLFLLPKTKKSLTSELFLMFTQSNVVYLLDVVHEYYYLYYVSCQQLAV